MIAKSILQLKFVEYNYAFTNYFLYKNYVKIEKNIMHSINKINYFCNVQQKLRLIKLRKKKRDNIYTDNKFF